MLQFNCLKLNGNGGVGMFDVRGGAAFFFGSNLPSFWLHA